MGKKHNKRAKTTMKKKTTYLTLIIIMTTIATAATTDNMTAYHRMEDATDLLGTYNLTNTGAATFNTGKVGNALYSNATAYLTTANDLGITNGAITMACWIKPTIYPANGYAIGIQNHQDTSTNVGYYTFIYNNSGTYTLYTTRQRQNVVNQEMTNTTAVPTLNEWTWIALVYDGTRLYSWINGTNASNIAASGNGASGSFERYSIGESGGRVNNLGGTKQLDECVVYNRALSTTEMQSLYGNTSYPYGTIVSITNSTWNMTTANQISQQGWWQNGNQTTSIPTRDTTPTIKFTTNMQSRCRIHTQDQNWTTMTSSRDCETTGGLTQICSLAAADKLITGSGYNNIYTSCIDLLNSTEGSKSTSGLLNVSLDLYNIIGTVKDQNAQAINNSIIMIIDQSIQNTIWTNTTSNGTGNWTAEVYSANWTVIAYDPSYPLRRGDVKTFISVP